MIETGRILRRTSRLCLVILTAAALLAPAPAAFAKKKKKGPPDLPNRIAAIAQQLWGVPLDESQPLTSQVEKLVLDHLNQWFTSHPPESQPPPGDEPYAVEVRREIEGLFADLHYPLYANVNSFGQPFGDGRLLAAGYTLGWSDFDRANVIALYEIHGTAVEQVALTHFIPDVDIRFHVFDPPPSAAGQFWFLAYGTRLGKSSPRLSAELYAFDGKALKSLWKIQDVYDGKFAFSPAGGRFVMSYLKEDELTQAIATNQQVTRHQAAYHLAPGGLDREYDR
ncbi:MAG TPA: hypothetical protein VGZ29_00150 [Terriglobia bacterium]|nr:hypothetical protein [Terriglobia bacterium]